MLEVSLGSSWLKDSPRMEAPGFPEPDGAEIWKNVLEVLPPSIKYSPTKSCLASD